MRLQALAPGKVNLGLLLGPLRADGRHELATLLESVSLADELTLTPAPGADGDVVHCPGIPGENLAAGALRALRAHGWDAPPVRIEIVKRIPVAAGMGGGSADAAATLRLAAAYVPLPGADLGAIAAGLGADVPSQLVPGLWFGTGAGDEVAAVAPLADHAWVIAVVSEALPTAAVYAEADRLGLPRPAAGLQEAATRLRSAVRRGARLADAHLVNDLQPATMSLLPSVAATLRAVSAAGVDHAMVSGSGPTVVGIVWGRGAAGRATEIAAQLHAEGRTAVAAVPVDAASGAPRPASPS